MTRIDTVLFDLDDTLYRELDFVVAALACVAEFLEQRTGVRASSFREDMLKILETHGRGHVFDLLLKQHDLPLAWVSPMLFVYRRARPRLQLFPDARNFLERLRFSEVQTGIVTDGCALVQAGKVTGLGLETLMDIVVYTDTLGEGAGKPSSIGYEVALELLEADPSTSAYVANDVRKDFVGPRHLGMTGVLVTRGMLGVLDRQPESHRPHHMVHTLEEVGFILEGSSHCTQSHGG